MASQDAPRSSTPGPSFIERSFKTLARTLLVDPRKLHSYSNEIVATLSKCITFRRWLRTHENI